MVSHELYKIVKNDNNIPVLMLDRLFKQEGVVVEINDGKIKKSYKEN